MSNKIQIDVKKSYTYRHVRLGIIMEVGLLPSIETKIGAEITTSSARKLATELIAEADKADAIADKKDAER